MLKSIEGIYDNGQIELSEAPQGVSRARVIVTFLPVDESTPQPPSFTARELAELRGKLAAWDDDWNAPGMEAYDAL